jgi:hypothetical protein
VSVFFVECECVLMLYAEGRDLAAQFGCPFVETSAKQRIGVDAAFVQVVREIRKYNKVSDTMVDESELIFFV